MIAFVALAHAQQDGWVLPNAARMETGEGYAGLGGVALTNYGYVEPAVLVQAGVAPDERVAFHLRGVVFPNLEGAFGLVGVRYLALDRERVRLAPWAGVGGMLHDERGYGWRWGSVGADGVVVAGVALEAGGERVWFDLSAPVVGAPVGGWTTFQDPRLYFIWLAGTEIGADFRVGERHLLRVGQESLAPSFTWRWLGDHVYTELNVSTAIMVNVVSFAVGGRF